MIIEVERDDSIIYSNATQHDFEKWVRNANILFRGSLTTIERVKKPNGIIELQIVNHTERGEDRLTVVEYDEQEQEMIVYF